MLVIGVTGGIGTGKTTVTEYLKSKGFAHIDADQIGRDLTADGRPLLEIIRREFGCVSERPHKTRDEKSRKIGDDKSRRTGKDKPCGTEDEMPFKTGDTSDAGNGLVLDRKALAAIVFNDTAQREKFDNIIHSEMKIVIDRQIAEYRSIEASLHPCAQSESETDSDQLGTAFTCSSTCVILDAPLLYEAGIDDRCDLVMLITSGSQTRIRRVCDRDQCSPAEVQIRINSQLSDEFKRARADFIVDNSGNLDNLYKQLDDILAEILSRNT